jgi:hypothetical protein
MPQRSDLGERIVLHVVFHDAWRIQSEGEGPLPAEFGTKEEAVAEAKRIAKGTPLGQVVIHKEDHTIETEYTYGNDPRVIPG